MFGVFHKSTEKYAIVTIDEMHIKNDISYSSGERALNNKNPNDEAEENIMGKKIGITFERSK